MMMRLLAVIQFYGYWRFYGYTVRRLLVVGFGLRLSLGLRLIAKIADIEAIEIISIIYIVSIPAISV